MSERQKLSSDDEQKVTGGAMHATLNVGKCAKCWKLIPDDPNDCFRTKLDIKTKNANGEDADGTVVTTYCKECYQKELELFSNDPNNNKLEHPYFFLEPNKK